MNMQNRFKITCFLRLLYIINFIYLFILTLLQYHSILKYLIIILEGKMKKNIFAALFLLLASILVFAAGSSEKESKDLSGKTLNVVATSAYKELFDAFTAKTNVKVEFLSMSSGEVLARTRAEGKSMADVWFGGGLDAFMAAKTDGLLENYVSPNSKDIPAQYKDPDGAWIAKGITVVGFIGNKDVLAEK